MTNKEFAELLEYIDTASDKFENVTVYRVHSSYSPRSGKISKITLKVNYTKDGKPLPKIINGILPKNVIQRSQAFKSDECNKEIIVKWLDGFIEEKAS